MRGGDEENQLRCKYPNRNVDSSKNDEVISIIIVNDIPYIDVRKDSVSKLIVISAL